MVILTMEPLLRSWEKKIQVSNKVTAFQAEIILQHQNTNDTKLHVCSKSIIWLSIYYSRWQRWKSIFIMIRQLPVTFDNAKCKKIYRTLKLLRSIIELSKILNKVPNKKCEWNLRGDDSLGSVKKILLLSECYARFSKKLLMVLSLT